VEADEFITRCGFSRNENYKYPWPSS
jgi:hypothetical protein